MSLFQAGLALWCPVQPGCKICPIWNATDEWSTPPDSALTPAGLCEVLISLLFCIWQTYPQAGSQHLPLRRKLPSLSSRCALPLWNIRSSCPLCSLILHTAFKNMVLCYMFSSPAAAVGGTLCHYLLNPTWKQI